jgi:hypothetical protein
MGAVEARAEIERFGNELREHFRDLAEEQVYDTMALLSLDLFRELVQGSREGGSGAVNGTPVDLGRARGNWQIGIGAVPAGLISAEDKQGAATITRESAKVLADALRQNPFQLLWITNNVPYIERLEDGWSKQAPDGWIRLAVERTRRRLPARSGGAA